MAYPTAHHLPTTPAHDEDSGAVFKAATILLGILVGVMAIVGIFILAAAKSAQDDANRAAAKASAPMDMSSMHMPATTAPTAGMTATRSFAGIAPANADALAAAHVPFPAELPALHAGSVVP